jgi:hypothetical protein
MKILIFTPLYPPDIADPAPYVKELAVRLKDNADITIMAYNHIPEKIEGVKIIVIEKSRSLILRLMTCTFRLLWYAEHADIVYVQNGPSTELPAVLVSLVSRKPFILRLGDEAALRFAQKRPFLKHLQRLAITRAHHIIVHSDALSSDVASKNKTRVTTLERPKPKPEILPFKEDPETEMNAYLTSWNNHAGQLLDIFKHAR